MARKQLGAAPSGAGDTATKGYVDAAVPALSGMLTLVQAVCSGGETYTISGGSVTQIAGTAVNGYSPAVGDRLLVVGAPASTGAGTSQNPTTQPTNGIYTVTNNTTNLTVSRAIDMSGSIKPQGKTIFAGAGTWGGGCLWTVVSPTDTGAFTYGTTSMKWHMTGGLIPWLDALGINNASAQITMWNGSGLTVFQTGSSVGAQTITLPGGSGTLAMVGSVTGMLQPCQVMCDGSEAYTISSGSVIQINGTTVNGVTPAIGDRILLALTPATTGSGSQYNLTTLPTNGIYTVTGNTTNLSLARATDMAGSNKPGGMSVYVEAGTWNPKSIWSVITPSTAAAFTYGTNNIAWKPTGGVNQQPDTVYLSAYNSLAFWNGNGTTTLIFPQNQGNTSMTFPAANDTLVGRNSTDVLTLKELKNYSETVYAGGTKTTTYTIDLTNGNIQTITLTASTTCAITKPTAVSGKAHSYALIVTQAAGAGAGLLSFSGVKWADGIAPVMTPTAGAIDHFYFTTDGVNTFGTYVQGFA